MMTLIMMIMSNGKAGAANIDIPTEMGHNYSAVSSVDDSSYELDIR